MPLAWIEAMGDDAATANATCRPRVRTAEGKSFVPLAARNNPLGTDPIPTMRCRTTRVL